MSKFFYRLQKSHRYDLHNQQVQFLYKHFGIAITIYKNYGLYGNKVIKPKEGHMYFVWTIWQTGYRAYYENGEFHSINDGSIIKNVAKYN